MGDRGDQLARVAIEDAWSPRFTAFFGWYVERKLRGAFHAVRMLPESEAALQDLRAHAGPVLVALNRLTMNVTDEVSPSLTADGGTIVFASGAGIETMTSTGSGRRVLLPRTEGVVDLSPAVAPDGQTVAFISNRGDVAGDRYDVWLFSRASGELRQLTRGSDALGGLSWSGDSKRVAFTTTATSTRTTGIGLADVESGSFRILTEQNDSNPSLSARGDRLLFVSSRDGDQELYMLTLNSGRVERLTFSAGLDDSPIFLATPNVGRPSRATR